MAQLVPSHVRDILVQVAFAAGQDALKVQNTTKVVKDTGGGGGITTQADLDAQAIVITGLIKEFPGIPIVGEEGNALTVCPPRAFIVDPVDGSAPYKAGAPDWTTTVAYRSPEFSVGVIYRPATGRLYSTRSNSVNVWDGFGQKNQSVRTLSIFEAHKPQWRICSPVCGEFSGEAWREVFYPLITDKRVRSFDNVSCNTAHFIRLFEGWVDGVIMWAKTWDSAAAIPMAKLLGITVTDFEGNEPDLSIIEPQRLVFARGKEVSDFLVSRTQYWPSPDRELRPKS